MTNRDGQSRFLNDYAKVRVDYSGKTLNETDLLSHPLGQFEAWYHEVVELGLPEPNAMVLSTANSNGKVSARHVLLKDVDERGFIFFSNYKSDKARDIASNPHVALTFSWIAIFRQVLVGGVCEKLSEAESVAYFSTRPRGAQIAAHASHQSEILSSRLELENRYEELEKEFAGREIPKPEHWGGYLVIPESIEFWSGRSSRLHDRVRFVSQKLQPNLSTSDDWVIERRSP